METKMGYWIAISSFTKCVFSPITAFAISESGNFADVPDDHYEKANLLAAIEEELRERFAVFF